MRTSIALLLSGLAAQQVSATWSMNAGKFNSPFYNNNECSDTQKGGFNWGDLPTGSFSSYGDFNFQGGWSCRNSFGKRDSLTKRTFGSKCITNTVSQNKPASFDCTKRTDGFSITDFQVSVEFDCDLEFHYTMPDKSICKQISACKKDGTTVQNTQCGGAQSVDIYLGSHLSGRESCEIGLHQIGFDCNPPYTHPRQSYQPVESQPASTYTSEIIESTTQEASYTTIEIPQTTQEASSTTIEIPQTTQEASYSTIEIPQTTQEASYSTIEIPQTTQEASYSTIEIPQTTQEASYSTIEIPQTTQEASYSTIEIPQTTTAAIESTTETVQTTTQSPVQPPLSTQLVYSNSSTAAYSAPAYSAPAYSAPPQESSIIEGPSTTGAIYTSAYAAIPSSVPGYTPPDVLPKCMETWLEINTQCKDSTDSSCYCKNPDFTKNVIDCVSAWSTNAQIQEALKYLLGICASYIPQNPGLITNCPSNIPLNPTGSAPPSYVATPTGTAPLETTAAAVAPPAAPSGPVTTITYHTTATLTQSTGGTTVTIISTEVTVPQVVFTTHTLGTSAGPQASAPVGLVPGTPAPVPAQTTGAPYPIPSSLRTVSAPLASGTGTGAITTAPAQFTGAASTFSVGFEHAVFGAALAYFAF